MCDSKSVYVTCNAQHPGVVCVCVFNMCVCVCIYIYMYVCVFNVCVCVYLYMYVCVCVCVTLNPRHQGAAITAAHCGNKKVHPGRSDLSAPT